MRLAILAAVAAYAVVVSQPLMYIVALTRAQNALSAPAYIELRQQINAAMNRRVPPIYIAALLLSVLVTFLAFQGGAVLLACTTAVALLCLVADAFFMIKENLPINAIVDNWSADAYPVDWEHYRTRWFEIFRYRQFVLLLGFAVLLIGAVYGA